MNKFYISPYAIRPSKLWEPDLEREFFHELKLNSSIRGIEHPAFFDSEIYNDEWLLNNLSENWDVLITCLPSFMNKMSKNPYFGIASSNEEGRKEAQISLQKTLDYAKSLNDRLARNAVKIIHFHSLPRNNEVGIADSKFLEESLYHISKNDFEDIKFVLEHCDAYVPNQLADKGFLSLEEEVRAIEKFDSFGISINWARSAIEGRSENKPLDHIGELSQKGMLSGVIFSGCTDDPESKYGAWRDTHMPTKMHCKNSLLGKDEIKQVMESINPDIFLGIKISNRIRPASLSASVGMINETINYIHST